MSMENIRPRVVIVGGGFGGMYAAKELSGGPFDVTLVDRRNFHLFQPLLYQVAMGDLSPGDIAWPLRRTFRDAANVSVVKDEVIGFDAAARQVLCRSGDKLKFDKLIVATGSQDNFFGRDAWSADALPLKTVEDALGIRREILLALETAEASDGLDEQRHYLTFVVIGGGPTGVELAGALAQMSTETVAPDFRKIDTRNFRVILVQGDERLLPGYSPRASANALKRLKQLGVEVMLGAFAREVSDRGVLVRTAEGETAIEAATMFWAAGVRPSPLAAALARDFCTELDRTGRVQVNSVFQLESDNDVFVIGDMCTYLTPSGMPLPGIAPAAIQGGRYVAYFLSETAKGRKPRPFRYKEKGQLAVIGRGCAVAEFWRLSFDGLFAWLIWALVHIYYLIGFTSRLRVMLNWAWNYFTHKKANLLIVAAPAVPAGDQRISDLGNRIDGRGEAPRGQTAQSPETAPKTDGDGSLLRPL